MLKAPIEMPNGEMQHPTKGTPQGGILSPLLSNIVLNELDWWVSSQWETMPTHACEFSHSIAVVDSILGSWVRQIEPDLKQIHP